VTCALAILPHVLTDASDEVAAEARAEVAAGEVDVERQDDE